MSHPTPKFKQGDLAIIVGCLNMPECNGQVVCIQSRARWLPGRAMPIAGIGEVERPDGWIYLIEIGSRKPWVHELRLRPYDEGPKPGSWEIVEEVTGWCPIEIVETVR